MIEPSRVIGLHFKSKAAAAACAHSLPERVIPKIDAAAKKKLITEKLFCFYDVYNPPVLWLTFEWLTFEWLTFEWLTFEWLTFEWLTFDVDSHSRSLASRSPLNATLTRA